MKRVYFKLALNALIFCFFSFIISFVIFYYLLDRKLAIVLSATVGAFIATSIAFFGLRAENKKKEKLAREKLVDEVLGELCFMPRTKVTDLFFTAFTKLQLTPKKTDAGLLLQGENKTMFFNFSFDGLKKSDVVKAFNKIQNDGVAVIYANDCDKETVAFANRFNGRVEIKTKADTFALLEKAQSLPQVKHKLLDLTQTKKLKFSAFLDRKKAVKFLTLGISFLLFSFFVPLKIYYITFGGCLSIFALGVMIFVKPEKSEP